jgi:hypothetical protein
VSAVTKEGPLGTIEDWPDGRAQVVPAPRVDADAAAGYAFPAAN